MTQTTADESGRTFLVLPVAAVRTNSNSEEESSWCAHVCDPASPLAGMYSFGPSLAAVRDSIATLAWAEVITGELAQYGLVADLAGIHVAITTTAEYEADWLTASVHAAA